jgi:hypothetical protein
MSEEDVKQEEEQTAGDAPEASTDDAPEASADETVQGDDSAVADTVDDIAVGKLNDPAPSPQPEGTVGDPIGAAEEHIASLDMDEERRKLQELQNKL